MAETGGEKPPQKAQRLDTRAMNDIAGALDKQGKHTLANSLRQPGPSLVEIRERQHKDFEARFRETDAMRAAETPVVPPDLSGEKTVRFDTEDVYAMLDALEQAKKFPVPQGEEPGQFYYRKAMELLSPQGKEQQK